MRTSAQWIAEAVSGRLVGNDVGVTGSVVTDSREAQAGSLYVARRGESAASDSSAPLFGDIARSAVGNLGIPASSGSATLYPTTP